MFPGKNRCSDFVFTFAKVQKEITKTNLLRNCTSLEEIHDFFLNDLNRKTIAPYMEHSIWLENTARQTGIQWIDYYHTHYPPLLREIADPPILLFFIGNSAVLQNTFIAAIGTRKPSPISTIAAAKLPLWLKTSGALNLVSGMAVGIDREVMLSAIQNDLNVVGVLGTPIYMEYPVANADLYAYMKQSEKCVLITEYHQEERVYKYSFPKRNRIISGMSESVFLMEAPLKSGAMSTAHSALEQNRDVIVFSHPQQKNNQGGEKLIREGASLLTTDRFGLRLKHLNDELPTFEQLPAWIALWEKNRTEQKNIPEKNGYFSF